MLCLVACAEEREPAGQLVDLDAGKSLVENNCSGCHTPDGRGKTAEIPNLAVQPANYLVEAMHAYREGRRHHAALQDLIAGFSEADIQNVATYFASLPPLPPAPGGRGEADPDPQGKTSRGRVAPRSG